MQHLDEGTIHSWLDGALSTAESARVEAHVAACPQCAAAVAEARGFIAASSRILTALDHAPRGVVPDAPQVGWWNRTAWRTAAAMLVVAVGGLVVFRNGGKEARIATNVDTTSMQSGPAPTTPAADTKPPVTAQRNPSPGALSAASTQADYSGKAVAPVQPNIPRSESKGIAKSAGGLTSEKLLPSGGYAGAETAGQVLLRSRVAGVAVLDSSSEQLPLKVVGTPRTFGPKVTLYEVAPGDTVTLTEVPSVSLLESVVTTATGMTSRTMAATAPAASARRRDTSTVSTPGSQRAAGSVGGQSTTPMAAAAAPQIENAIGVINTITWTDATSGNTMKLSGRMPAVQLQQIRFRIERERAAAAAKKKP
jgi:anti-sigma factor RsiW